MQSILIVDDEPAICASLSFALEDQFEVYIAPDEDTALDILANGDIDLVLLDLRLGNRDGIEVLKMIKDRHSDVAVIIMTAHGTIQSSVDAMRAGAFYYITKPIHMEELEMLLHNAKEYLSLKSRVAYLNDKITQMHEVTGIIGQNETMQEIFRHIDKVKDIDSTILITGESGTGKELVAKAIHYAGRRRREAFEVINCAAIPSELLESELFGHEKGAFTGAVQKKKGLFEQANNGTLFLDEIGEMDLKLQAKLLRVVQEKEISPLGSGERRKIDVRIICATNRDLKKEAQAGRFREDLFFRLNVITVNVPPLRDRLDDVPLLVHHFIQKFSRSIGRAITGIDPEALEYLTSYPFPGNVRELENILERAVVFTEGPMIMTQDLPEEVRFSRRAWAEPTSLLIPVYVGEDMKTVEKKVILKTLRHLDNDKSAAAKMLHISERKLFYKLKEYDQEEDPLLS